MEVATLANIPWLVDNNRGHMKKIAKEAKGDLIMKK